MTPAQVMFAMLDLGGWTQAELARRLEVPSSTTARWANQARADDGEVVTGRAVQPNKHTVAYLAQMVAMDLIRRGNDGGADG